MNLYGISFKDNIEAEDGAASHVITPDNMDEKYNNRP